MFDVARGKKTDIETITKIFISFAQTGNYAETAKNLDLPYNTVKGVINKNKDKKEFAKLLDKKKEEFTVAADALIDKGLMLIKRRLDRALDKESELDEIIDEISSNDELSEKTKQSLTQTIRNLQLTRLTDITTMIGVLYDKRALAKGELTEKAEIEIRLCDDE